MPQTRHDFAFNSPQQIVRFSTKAAIEVSHQSINATGISPLHNILVTFCMLVDDIELHGFTPEAYQVVEESNKWLNGQCLIAKAFLTQSLVQEELDNYFVPSKKEQNAQVFCELETAINWLKSQPNY
jgi:hypothetical protein